MNRRRPRGAYVVALAVGVILGCGKTVATLSYETIGSTKETPLVVAGGARVGFSTHAAKYSYNGTNSVVLDGELLKGGAVVATVTCDGFALDDSSGSGCGANRHNFMCFMTAPPGGADTVRMATRMKYEGAATFEGFEVRVERW